MRASFDNNLLASAYLYADHVMCQIGQAYGTVTTKLFPTVDPRLPAGYQGYSAPLVGWVYDSGVSGAHIINEVSGGGYSAPLTRASGVRFDYLNGRVVLPSSITLPAGNPLTGTYSFKEANLLLSNENEDPLVTQGKYFLNPRFTAPLSASGVPPGNMVTPAVFIAPLTTRNDAFQLGGLVNTKTTMTLTIMAETSFQLTSLLSLFRDCRYQYLPMVNTVDAPLDGWNDVKGGTGFNYKTLVAQYGQPGNLVYIEDVHVARVSDRAKANPQLFLGVVDLDLSYVRQSPIGSNIFV